MSYTRGAALVLLAASAAAAPLSDASAGCWRWRCGPPLIALPFIAAGTVVAGAATIATAPFAAVAGAPYYGPRGYYYGPPAYYYGPPPGYYGYPYYDPAPVATNN